MQRLQKFSWFRLLKEKKDQLAYDKNQQSIFTKEPADNVNEDDPPAAVSAAVKKTSLLPVPTVPAVKKKPVKDVSQMSFDEI